VIRTCCCLASHARFRRAARRPGCEKAFVDYVGKTMAVVDRHTGEIQVAEVFVAARCNRVEGHKKRKNYVATAADTIFRLRPSLSGPDSVSYCMTLTNCPVSCVLRATFPFGRYTK
jgi:hypothetical protein